MILLKGNLQARKNQHLRCGLHEEIGHMNPLRKACPTWVFHAPYLAVFVVGAEDGVCLNLTFPNTVNNVGICHPSWLPNIFKACPMSKEVPVL